MVTSQGDDRGPKDAKTPGTLAVFWGLSPLFDWTWLDRDFISFAK